MINLLKSQHYKVRKMWAVKIVYVIGFLAMPAFLWAGGFFRKGITASELLPNIMSAGMFLSIYILCLLVTLIFGMDYMDKTIRYEALAGHSRLQIFLSRVLIAYFYTFLGVVLTSVLPGVLVRLFLDYGSSCDSKEIFLRYGVFFLIAVRMIASMILFTALTQNPLAGAVSLIVLMLAGQAGGAVMKLFTDNEDLINGLFWSKSIMVLSEFNQKPGFAEGRDFTYYDASLPPAFVSGALAAGVLLSMATLFLGYLIMKKTDM